MSGHEGSAAAPPLDEASVLVPIFSFLSTGKIMRARTTNSFVLKGDTQKAQGQKGTH